MLVTLVADWQHSLASENVSLHAYFIQNSEGGKYFRKMYVATKRIW